MANTRLRFALASSLIVAAVLIYASHAYAENQAYKTGVYMGKTSFQTEDFKNRTCVSHSSDPRRPGCEVHDLKKDSVMEDALASAQIIPALSDSTALRSGFRDGWREARNGSLR